MRTVTYHYYRREVLQYYSNHKERILTVVQASTSNTESPKKRDNQTLALERVFTVMSLISKRFMSTLCLRPSRAPLALENLHPMR